MLIYLYMKQNIFLFIFFLVCYSCQMDIENSIEVPAPPEDNFETLPVSQDPPFQPVPRDEIVWDLGQWVPMDTLTFDPKKTILGKWDVIGRNEDPNRITRWEGSYFEFLPDGTARTFLYGGIFTGFDGYPPDAKEVCTSSKPYSMNRDYLYWGGVLYIYTFYEGNKLRIWNGVYDWKPVEGVFMTDLGITNVWFLAK